MMSNLLLFLLMPVAWAHVEQVHMMYGAATSEMVVSWATPVPARSDCLWGLAPDLLTWKVQGVSEVFTQTVNKTKPSYACPGCITEYLHYCTLHGLLPGTRYYYKVGSFEDKLFSKVLSFRSRRSHHDPSAMVLGVYGDLGLENDVSLTRLEQFVDAGSFEAVIHVGDFAYDLDDDGGERGQTFMRSIEPIASAVPYITCIGNHEYGDSKDTGALQHYIRRFGQLMPGGTDGMYFSLDIGKVHLIALTTEPYFWQTAIKDAQMEWLEKDLIAVDRKRTPWLVVIAHRPPYCSNNTTDDCALPDSVVRAAFEPILYDYGVDIVFWGHEHTYERMYPTFNDQAQKSTSGSSDPYENPGGPINIITGSAGCSEYHGADWVQNPKEWSAARSMAYGFGQLEIISESVMRWKQFDEETGEVVDEFQVTKYSPYNHLQWQGARRGGKKVHIRGVGH